MSWKQTLYPNLDDKKLVVYYQGKPLMDWFLWCLAVAQKTFNVAPFAASAQIAWNWNNTKHQDHNLPDGCFVPIWWTGGAQNYGHVAIAKRSGNHIQIWTSPYRHKPYFDYFEGELNATIDTVSRIYGCTYAGWTETMNTTRVVEWVNPPKPEEKPQEAPKQPEQPVEPPKSEPVPETPKPDKKEDDKESIKPEEKPIEEEEKKESNKETKSMESTLTDEQINKINEEYMKLANASTEAIAEAGSGFEFSNKTKIVAYLIGDFLLLGSAITPQVVLAIMSLNDKNMTAFGTALASILATLGSQILLIFKLLKKKGEKNV